MHSREAARDGVRHILWLAALFELERPTCVCDLRVYRCDSMLLVARLLLVLPSTMEPAHDLGRFGCVLAELRAMKCGICGGLLALLNAGVRGARLLLAVARGRWNSETAQRVVCASTLELDDDLRCSRIPTHVF